MCIRLTFLDDAHLYIASDSLLDDVHGEVLEDAEDGHAEVGHRKVGEEEVGVTAHAPMQRHHQHHQEVACDTAKKINIITINITILFNMKQKKHETKET